VTPGTTRTLLAIDAQTWGGEVVGIVAAVIFVVFAVYIVVSRLRNGRHGTDRDVTGPAGHEKVER
jgi:hypothetical protein